MAHAAPATQIKSLGCKYSKKDVMSLKELFDSQDRNHDGKVTPAELRASMKDHGNMGANAERGMDSFRAMDKNHDGFLTFDEYLVALFPLANAKDMKVMMSWTMPEAVVEYTYTPSEEQMKDLRAIFKMYDTDKSGSLDKAELLRMAKGTGYDAEEFEALFAMSDKDNDQKISMDEFVLLMKKCFV